MSILCKENIRIFSLRIHFQLIANANQDDAGDEMAKMCC